jgi:anti-sigma B factor antagonist
MTLAVSIQFDDHPAYADAMHFDCTSEKLADVVVVTPIGEVDRDTAPRVRELLAEAARDTDGRVEVELSHVTFLDSSGIGALLFGRQQAITAGVPFRLRRPAEPVRSVLQITNVWPLFDVE